MGRLGLIIILLLGIGGAVAWFALDMDSGRNGGDVQEAERAAEEIRQQEMLDEDTQVDLALEKIELTQGEEGAPQWKLKAAKAQYQQEKGLVEVVSPEVTYYESNGTQGVTVKADNGLVEQERETVRLWGAVSADTGQTLIGSEEMLYSGEDRTLLMTGQVLMQSEHFNCTTPTLLYHMETQAFELNQGVSANFFLVPSEEETQGEEDTAHE